MSSTDRAPGRWVHGRLGAFVLPLTTVVALVGIWEAAVALLDVPRWLLPAPSAVWAGLLESIETLPRHTWATLVETLNGYLLAVVTGIPLAVAIVYSRALERTVYPLLVAMQAVPKVAIAPIVVVWFGFGLTAKVVIVFLVCFFPIIISAVSGLRSTPAEYVEMVRSYEASEWEIFRRVRFPSALPHLFVGLKVAISLAVIGAVIGEFVGANRGLGYLIIISGGNVRTDIAFGSIVLLSAMSVLLFYVLVALERWLVPWSEQRVQPM